MRSTANKIRKQARALRDVEKLRLVDELLADLDKPDPEIDRVWAEESHRRWKAYKAKRVKSLPYAEVVKRIRKG